MDDGDSSDQANCPAPSVYTLIKSVTCAHSLAAGYAFFVFFMRRRFIKARLRC